MKPYKLSALTLILCFAPSCVHPVFTRRKVERMHMESVWFLLIRGETASRSFNLRANAEYKGGKVLIECYSLHACDYNVIDRVEFESEIRNFKYILKYINDNSLNLHGLTPVGYSVASFACPRFSQKKIREPDTPPGLRPGNFSGSLDVEKSKESGWSPVKYYRSYQNNNYPANKLLMYYLNYLLYKYEKSVHWNAEMSKYEFVEGVLDQKMRHPQSHPQKESDDE